MLFTPALAFVTIAIRQPTITFESIGISVRDFCGELSRLTGTQFRAFDEVQDDLLAIRLSDAPLSEVLDKLKLVERAKITQNGAAFDVRPDSVARLASRVEVHRARVGWARAAIENSNQRLRKTGPYASVAASAAKVIGRYGRDPVNLQSTVQSLVYGKEPVLPLQLAEARIIASLDPEQVGTALESSRTVWSTSPTPAQHAINLDSATLFATLREEGSIWNHALAESAPDAQQGLFEVGSSIEYERIAVLHLELRPLQGSDVDCALFAYDAGGRRIGSVEFDFNPPEPPAAPTPLGAHLPSVPLSPDVSAAMYLWFNPEAELRSEMTPLRTEAFERLFLDPEHQGPVAETVGRSFVELSRATSKQLIASETVQMAVAMPTVVASGRDLKLDSVRDFLVGQARDPFRVAEPISNDDWLTVRPYDLQKASDFEVSRTKLGAYLRGIKASGVRDFHSLTDLAAASGHEWQLAVERWIGPGAQILFPGSSPLGGAYDFPELLRLIGLLTSEQLDLATRQGMPLSQFSSAALTEMGLIYPRPKGETLPDLLREPTVSMPLGVPGGGVLHISRTDEAILRVQYQTGGPPAKHYVETIPPITAVTGGRIRFSDNWQDKETYRLLSIRAIRLRKYEFTFSFPGDLAFEPINSWTCDYVGEAVGTVAELPPEYRAAIQKAYDDSGLRGH